MPDRDTPDCGRDSGGDGGGAGDGARVRDPGGERREFVDVLAAECGGSPADYRADPDDLRPLDEAAVDPEEFDMTADGGGLDVDAAELADAERVDR